MGRDTIQLENAVSTISQEYLLEFTSEYDIPEDLHPELPDPEDTIVDFSEGKVGRREDIPHRRGLTYKRPKGWDAISWFLFRSGRSSVGYKPNGCVQPDVQPEPVQSMEDTTVASRSSGTPSIIEKSPLDFDNENPTPSTTEGVGAGGQAQDGLTHEVPSVETATTTEVIQEPVLKKEVAATGPPMNKRRRQRGTDEAEANAHPISSKGTATKILPQYVAITKVNVQLSVRSLDSGKSTSIPSMDRSPGGIYQPGWSMTNNCRLDTLEACQDMVAMGSQLRLRFEQEVRLLKEAKAKIARRDQRIQVREEEIKKLDEEIKSLRTVEIEVHGLRNRTRNLETLLEAEVDIKKVAEAKNDDLTKELESLRAQFFDLKVNNNQLSQQVSNLQPQVTGEERIKASFEEFKKYEDDKVEQWCAEMDAILDALSIDFDAELYPYMLTAIASHRWVIGHGLAVMKCAESTETRQVFADVVSTGIVKEAEAKYVAALSSIEEGLKIYSSDRRSAGELKILVYPKVRDPKDPWSFKEEILLADAIMANISRTEKKKKYRVVCHTYGVASAHHARSDGVLVSVPTIAPRGLAILLADAATQTEDEASTRLLRSKSLPPMYNLDWP
ncbi:hypothetical protein Tco_0079514 [Tanacetum coccineum]